MADIPSPTPEEDVKTPEAAPAPQASIEAASSDSPPPAAPGGEEALSDGTQATTLAVGDSIGASIKPLVEPGKRRVTSIYRRADIFTSVITMVATLSIIGIIFGGYLFLNRQKKVPAPKISTLDQTEITKLGGFLGNNVGSPGNSQILTISSSSLLKGRVAIQNDLKVTGNTEIGGSTSTTNLTVSKQTILANTSINGPLTVTGPTTLQSPAILAGGATVGSNLAVAGNGTFGGALSAGSFNAKTLTVTGDINLSGHLIIVGAQPIVTADVGAGSGGKANVEGTDSGGTIIISTGTVPLFTNGQNTLVVLKFHTPYSKTPHVLLTPVGLVSGQINYFVTQTPTGFTISLVSSAGSANSYAYNYWVIQ